MERSGGEFTKMKQTLHLGSEKYVTCFFLFFPLYFFAPFLPRCLGFISAETRRVCVISAVKSESSIKVKQDVP